MPEYLFNGIRKNSNEPVYSGFDFNALHALGCFESLLATPQKIPLFDLHYERFSQTLHYLQTNVPASDELFSNSLQECQRFGVPCKIKWVAIKNHPSPDILIIPEALPSPANPLHISLSKYHRISPSPLSSLKLNNRVLYHMAALEAQQLLCDDVLLLNTQNVICDSTISNVFCIRYNSIYTPPISDGCLDGVFRKHCMEVFRNHGYQVIENSITPTFLLEADEIFLTNAVRGIRPVSSIEGISKKTTTTLLLQTLFPYHHPTILSESPTP